MLTNTMVKNAQKHGLVVPAFNIPHIPMLKPIIEAVRDEEAAALIQVARLEWEKMQSQSLEAIAEEYFKYVDEIYLVQSMDVLTIQPLTSFLRQLTEKGMFSSLKARVVLNKFIRTKEINENMLIGGMSLYNDPGMTVRIELFDKRTVPSVSIPFNLKTYLKYLDVLAMCDKYDISLNGYDKEFVLCLNKLANMVYPLQEKGNKKKEKYMPPSVKNNNSGFSPRVNDTLNKMKKNY